MLKALGKAGRGQCAPDLFGELRAAGVTHDANSYSALVCALQEGGVPESALGAFEAMRLEGFEQYFLSGNSIYVCTSPRCEYGCHSSIAPRYCTSMVSTSFRRSLKSTLDR